MGAILKQLKQKISSIETIIDEDTTDINDVLNGDEQSINEKLATIKRTEANLKRILTRFKKCHTSNEVFGEFSLEAAKAVVIEMFTASSSRERLRACEIILDRALGKVADRSVSLNVEVASMTDAELEQRIQSLNAELNFAGKKEEGLILIEETGNELT